MPLYNITPQDLLMFRDGRPMEANAGSGGHGGRWPEPSVIFDAIHAALHRAFPSREPWEHPHRFGRSSNRDFNRKETQRFGSLATAGPFPVRDGEWFFPAPQDVTQPDCYSPCLLPMDTDSGASDLPSKLYALGSTIAASKKTARPWWNKHAVECYLNGGTEARFPKARTQSDDDLFVREWTTGIAIAPETQTAAESQIYSAEYLRLRDEVTLGIHALMPMKNPVRKQLEEAITQLFPGVRTIIVGGQQRACHVDSSPGSSSLADVMPVSPMISGNRMKWLLLSPAVFPAIAPTEKKPDAIPHAGGWIPNWVADHDSTDTEGRAIKSGQVLLRKGASERDADENRQDWRERIRKFDYFNCHLVAARIPKPLVVSGWSERLHLKDDPSEINGLLKKKGARPTLLAVPAGAVYYFQGEDAPQLAETLAWHGAQGINADQIHNRRSTLLGEKGFGLGVCGTWNFFEDAPPPSDYSKNP
jgi:CRISPR type III-B/RAMP module-associated protein Cmr3